MNSSVCKQFGLQTKHLANFVSTHKFYFRGYTHATTVIFPKIVKQIDYKPRHYCISPQEICIFAILNSFSFNLEMGLHQKPLYFGSIIF